MLNRIGKSFSRNEDRGLSSIDIEDDGEMKSVIQRARFMTDAPGLQRGYRRYVRDDMNIYTWKEDIGGPVVLIFGREGHWTRVENLLDITST